jgi:hypothetical protein
MQAKTKLAGRHEMPEVDGRWDTFIGFYGMASNFGAPLNPVSQ